MSHIRYNSRNTELTGVSRLISCTPVQQFSNRTGLGGTSWGANKGATSGRRWWPREHWKMAGRRNTMQGRNWAGQEAREGCDLSVGSTSWDVIREQVAGRPWLDSAVLDSHRVHLLQWCCLIPSSLRFHTKLSPPGCTSCSAPRDSPATHFPLPHSTYTIPGALFLILGTTDLLHLLKQGKRTDLSSPSLTSILQGFWWRLFPNIPNLSVSVLHSLIALFLS